MNKTLGIVCLLLGVIIGGYLFVDKLANASVTQGNEYASYAFKSTDASSTAYTTLRTGQGVLGSVIISSSSPTTALPPIRIYDSRTGTTTATSTPINFGTHNQTHGTYTYDAVFTEGIIVEVTPGFNGVYTITWR
jgi:hypothetical protein